tara:strand:+ start:16 stop:327 length:312 start_codon:yes stop_codon:yes gene_type:complete
MDALSLEGFMATYDRWCPSFGRVGRQVPVGVSPVEGYSDRHWRCSSGRKLVTKVEASLNFLYNPNKFMDALELMMNALDIPFNVSSLASGETGLSYTEWCDSP